LPSRGSTRRLRDMPSPAAEPALTSDPEGTRDENCRSSSERRESRGGGREPDGAAPARTVSREHSPGGSRVHRTVEVVAPAGAVAGDTVAARASFGACSVVIPVDVGPGQAFTALAALTAESASGDSAAAGDSAAPNTAGGGAEGNDTRWFTAPPRRVRALLVFFVIAGAAGGLRGTLRTYFYRTAAVCDCPQLKSPGDEGWSGSKFCGDADAVILFAQAPARTHAQRQSIRLDSRRQDARRIDSAPPLRSASMRTCCCRCSSPSTSRSLPPLRRSPSAAAIR